LLRDCHIDDQELRDGWLRAANDYLEVIRYFVMAGYWLRTGSYYKKVAAGYAIGNVRMLECLENSYSGIGIFTFSRLCQSGIGIAATG
jgi:hypothetical protein